MFGPNCIKCGGSSFKLQELNVQNAAYKMYSIQCTSCNASIGVTDYYDSGHLLKQQEKKLVALEQQLSTVERYVRQIAQALPQ